MRRSWCDIFAPLWLLPATPQLRQITPENLHKKRHQYTASRSISPLCSLFGLRLIGLSVFGSRIQAKDHGLQTVQRSAYPSGGRMELSDGVSKGKIRDLFREVGEWPRPCCFQRAPIAIRAGRAGQHVTSNRATPLGRLGTSKFRVAGPTPRSTLLASTTNPRTGQGRLS